MLLGGTPFAFVSLLTLFLLFLTFLFFYFLPFSYFFLLFFLFSYFFLLLKAMVKYMLEDTYKIKSKIICIDADICKDFDAVVAMIAHDGSALFPVGSVP